MMNRLARSPGNQERRKWPTPSIVIAGVALFIALCSSAVAARGLIHSRDIAPGAVASKALKNGGVKPIDLNTSLQQLLQGGAGANGATGLTGAAGSNGANGANGPNGPNGANGVDGTNGTNGTDGTDGTNGINGTIVPRSATQGITALPTASPPTVVVALPVPAGNYVVLAKTQVSQTGAGDSVDCWLKASGSTLDHGAMKTLPALAAMPMSLQAVTTTTSPSTLSVECDVSVANGSAESSSLIAIPTG